MVGFEGKKEAPKDLDFVLIFSHYFGCGLDIFRYYRTFFRLRRSDPDIDLVCCNRGRLLSFDLGIFRSYRSNDRRNFAFPDNDRCCHKNGRPLKLGLGTFRLCRTFFRNHPFAPCICRFHHNIGQQQ